MNNNLKGLIFPSSFCCYKIDTAIILAFLKSVINGFQSFIFYLKFYEWNWNPHIYLNYVIAASFFLLNLDLYINFKIIKVYM